MGRRRKYSDSAPSSPNNSDAKRVRVRTSPSATVQSSDTIIAAAIVPLFVNVPAVDFVPPIAVVPFVATLTSLGAVPSLDAVFASTAVPAFTAVSTFIAGSLHPAAAMPPSAVGHPVANFVAGEGNLWLNNRYKKPTVEEIDMFNDAINSECLDYEELGTIDAVPVTKIMLISLFQHNLLK